MSAWRHGGMNGLRRNTTVSPSLRDGGACGRTSKRVARGGREQSAVTRADAILGVFKDLCLDEPEVSQRMKRLAEGWESQDKASDPRVLIRGDTLIDD